jgi:hypothetical protein
MFQAGMLHETHTMLQTMFQAQTPKFQTQILCFKTTTYPNNNTGLKPKFHIFQTTTQKRKQQPRKRKQQPRVSSSSFLFLK